MIYCIVKETVVTVAKKCYYITNDKIKINLGYKDFDLACFFFFRLTTRFKVIQKKYV